ncbi:PLP-dependent aminotransferase family protein [Bdellovibrio sp. HCB337]|uniref:aminotransferase-like domain-containing protein n=1 Tax=Bdellovibrio sp. HCB337 TaxID=3394358 RepID=UPI0039A46C9D
MKNTIYQKVYSDLISKMKNATLKSGDALPSTRDLSRLYRCHRFTIMRVCQDLVAEGWIESTPRSKYIVSAKIPVTDSAKTTKSKNKKSLSEIALSQPVIDLERTRYRLEFWGGQPDLRLFPKDEFRRVLSAGLKRTKPDQLNYGLTNGLESCLKEVSEYLRKSRNLTSKDYMVTNGSQEALYLATRTFVKPGDKIAVERKGYPPAWRLFESLGAILVPIEVDTEGLNTDDLKEKLKKHDIKMIYVTPLHQYPTTVGLSPRRRQNLIQIAERHHIPILEDDYDNEFHYIGPPPSPISAETDLGIYVCSFSKVLFPGARLGVLGCDANILEKMSYQKYLISRQTDSLSQIGLGAWIRDGGFERHLRKTRRIYEGRYFHMIEELKKIQAQHQIDWINPNGGMSIWVNLRQDSASVANRAKSKSVFFQNESSMDYLKSRGTHLRIGFAGVNEKEITEGLRILRDLL